MSKYLTSLRVFIKEAPRRDIYDKKICDLLSKNRVTARYCPQVPCMKCAMNNDKTTEVVEKIICQNI